MCYFFFSALLLLDHSTRLVDSTGARGKEAVVVVVAVRDDHKGDTRVFSGFFLFSPFLNLVKRFRVRLCGFSFSFLFSLFSYDSGPANIRLTHGEMYYEYKDLDTLQTPTWAYDVALEHRRNRRGATSDDIGVGV